MNNIIIIGSSGHAKVVIDIIEKENFYKIIGLVDSFKDPGEKVLDYKVLGQIEDIPRLIQKYDITGAVIAIGDNWSRFEVSKRIESLAPNLCFVNAIHPSAQLSKYVTIGRGCVIMANCVVNSDTIIGDFCILNSLSSLDHDCRMGAYSSLAPRAAIGGNVVIGEYSAICLGANVINRITVGRHTVIGAGSVVVRDIPEHVVAYGIPAKVIRTRKPGERYM